MGWPGFQLMGTNQGGSFIHAWCIFAHTEAPTAQMNMGGALMPQRMHICFLRCVCNLHVKLANVYVQILFDDLSVSGCVSGRSFMAFMPREHVWCMSGSSFQISGAVRWARPLSNTPRPAAMDEAAMQRSGVFFHSPSEWSLCRRS